MTNNHTVPQMYLRRFGRQPTSGRRKPSILARDVDRLDRPFSTNIRNVAAVTNFYGERVEKLLCQIEGDAVPAFDEMLDDPDWALPGPDRWPLGDVDRKAMAWWIAAQIVRTVRQRRRLQHIAGNGGDSVDHLTVPPSIRSMAGRDEHARFMTTELVRLSWVILHQPWGLGFSDLCLWTGDVPVVIMNGQDDENQPLAAAHWEVLLPLDPHRFLLLPGSRARDEDPGKRFDHLLKLPSGLGQVPNQMIFEAADAKVFCHEDHDPLPHMALTGPRLPTPWTGDAAAGPSWAFEYEVLEQGWTVERRWLTEHPPPRDPARTV